MTSSEAAYKLELARLEAKEKENEHKRLMEREEAAHERAMEAETARVEAEKAREEAAHERAMQTQRKAQKHELAVTESKRQNPPPAGSTSPKIHKWEQLCPRYEESSEITEYFITFKSLGTLHAIPEDQKMTTLIAKWTGRALDIFSKMPIDDASNYGKFKDLVLKEFQITPETYRVKFRSLKRGSGLSNVAYANEMRDLVDKWVWGKGITSFEGMCDLVTQEHFLNMCREYVKQYLWDKKVNAVVNQLGMQTLMSKHKLQSNINHWERGTGLGKSRITILPLGKRRLGNLPVPLELVPNFLCKQRSPRGAMIVSQLST
ncbi:uncharacterized protein LOC123367067 [Mauremys mutica]|uniref:uncharacterized protein LOC123367067 n=1 Tax=Mauremys mutica TaxID=74926 RepID=UPI001D15FF09|nr:uncharacterized protein LOC123367067 [Mauremys mutica]